ncbi:hypothetical protein HU200_022095 [Digitaria exilis]|uniref:HTH myb-type domain-containing protein n=1 Tax=Digitaria exilis TaxID=1010633 RepID=A0A835C5Q7_9POAL|nr:hypothetical protein HU200_022095 [Digitaria exilis]CAB3494576.1 unnamed protein product [Digitaria exilis]
MIELVDGVSKKGIGQWRKVKGDYFSASIRTAVHLKDKWRNLVRACKATNTSRKKANVQKATEVIVTRLRHRILALEAKHHKKK